MSTNKAAKTIFDKQEESSKQFEKFKEEQERIAAQVAEVKNRTHQAFVDFALAKAKNDAATKQLFQDFLNSLAKTKDKDEKAYLDILAKHLEVGGDAK